MKTTKLEAKAREQAEPMYTLTLDFVGKEHLLSVVMLGTWRNAGSDSDMERRDKLNARTICCQIHFDRLRVSEESGLQTGETYDLALSESQWVWFFRDVVFAATQGLDRLDFGFVQDDMRANAQMWLEELMDDGYIPWEWPTNTAARIPQETHGVIMDLVERLLVGGYGRYA